MNPLQQKRQDILSQIAQTKRMQRGTLSQQHFKVHREGKWILQGPYYVLQYYSYGKKVSRRIPKELVDSVRSDLKSYQHFEGLVEEFVEISEQMALEEDGIESSKKKEKRLFKKSTVRPKHS